MRKPSTVGCGHVAGACTVACIMYKHDHYTAVMLVYGPRTLLHLSILDCHTTHCNWLCEPPKLWRVLIWPVVSRACNPGLDTTCTWKLTILCQLIRGCWPCARWQGREPWRASLRFPQAQAPVRRPCGHLPRAWCRTSGTTCAHTSAPAAECSAGTWPRAQRQATPAKTC